LGIQTLMQFPKLIGKTNNVLVQMVKGLEGMRRPRICTLSQNITATVLSPLGQITKVGVLLKRLKKDARKSIHMGKTQKAGSATSKNAAAARKKTHKSVQARALRNSPQTVYRKEQLKSSTSKQKTTVAKKRKPADSSSESETESEHSSAEEVMDFDVINKSGGKGEKKKTGKEKASQEEINAGRKPAKGSRHEVRRVEGTFEGDMREGVPIVDARPGKKRTRAGRKRKDSRKGRKQARNLGDNIPDPTEILPPRAVQLRPTPEMLAAQRIESELPGIVEDPMLP